MRLIDADDLKDWSEIVPLTDDGGIDINDFDEKLESIPTVDAIPVSFIKEQLKNLQGIADYEFIESGGYFGICNHKLWALEDLLNQWAERKEE